MLFEYLYARLNALYICCSAFELRAEEEEEENGKERKKCVCWNNLPLSIIHIRIAVCWKFHWEIYVCQIGVTVFILFFSHTLFVSSFFYHLLLLFGFFLIILLLLFFFILFFLWNWNHTKSHFSVCGIYLYLYCIWSRRCICSGSRMSNAMVDQ